MSRENDLHNLLSDDLKGFYEKILDKIVGGVMISNQDDIIIYANEGMANIAGIPSESIVGLNFNEDFEENTVKNFLKHYDKAKDTKKAQIYDSIKVITPKGRKSYQSGWMIPLIKNDNYNGMICTVEDVSPVKRQDRTELYLDLAGVIIVALDLEGNVELLNRKGYEILGYEPGTLEGNPWFKICLPESEYDRVFTSFKKLINGDLKNIEFYENQIITKEGEIRDIEWQNTLLCDKEGNVSGTLSSGNDITEKKKAENALRISEEKYRTFIENFQGIAYQGFQDFTPILFQGNIEEMTGYTSDDFLTGNIKWNELIHPDDKNKIFDEVEQFNASDRHYNSNEHRIITKHNEIKWVLSKYEKFVDPKTKRDGTRGIIIDITEQKMVEKKLKELNQVKSELLRRTSHELKTPLVSIKGFSSLILELYKERLDEEVLTAIEEIHKGTARLESLIGDILTTSKLESGFIEMKIKEENLAFLIRFCVEELKGFIKVRGHTVNLDLPDTLITSFEKEQIHQVLNNLLTNAIKYTPRNGKIEVIARVKNNMVVISIKDNGVGFTKSEKRRVFKQFGKIERFGQGQDIVADGSGLGLYICKQIVNMHGGEIWIESRGRDKGSTVSFSLPYAKSSSK